MPGWRQRKGVGPHTINKEVTTLRSVFKSAIRRGLMKKNPVQGLARLKQDDLPHFRTLPEIEEFLRVNAGTLTAGEIKRVRRARVLTVEDTGEKHDGPHCAAGFSDENFACASFQDDGFIASGATRTATCVHVWRLRRPPPIRFCDGCLPFVKAATATAPLASTLL